MHKKKKRRGRDDAKLPAPHDPPYNTTTIQEDKRKIFNTLVVAFKRLTLRAELVLNLK